MSPTPRPPPLAYHLTWHPYGTWLPGDDRGWHRRPGGRRLAPAPALARYWRERLPYPPLFFTRAQRSVVRETIVEKCERRGWRLYAVRVLHDHVHVVVSANTSPEGVLNDFKRETTRRLRRMGAELQVRSIWARHGSTRYLFDEVGLRAVIAYVLDDHHGNEEGPPDAR